MSETLLSLLKKKKDPVKMKKVGIKAPKKGEVRVETTIVDKTEEASDIDMTDFRQRLKLNKNKTYRTLVNESKRQQEKEILFCLRGRLLERKEKRLTQNPLLIFKRTQ